MPKATENQIKAWKNKHKNVYEVEVPMEDGGSEMAYGYFKKPDLDIIGLSTKYAETAPVKAGEIMIDNCWIGGDKIIKEDSEMKLGAMAQLKGIFKARVAKLKKL